TGVQPRHANGMLVGIGATMGKEHVVHALGGALSNEPGGLGTRCCSMCRCDRGNRGSLLLNCRNHFGVLMSNIDVDHLRREITVAFPFGIPHVGAFSFDNVEWVQPVLCGPRVEHMFSV